MAKIEILYPEFCNIYGERYNVDYLMRCCDNLELIETHHGEVPAFTGGEISLVYLGCTAESKQELIIELLRPYLDDISREIERGTIFLITGNALEIFGSVIRDGERVIPCLGLFDFESVRRMDEFRHNSQYVARFVGDGDQELTLLGHRSQFSFAYGDFTEPFGEIEIGIGMNPDTKLEGLKRKHFYATYSLGPYLIMNPPFTKYLLRLMGESDDLCFEKEIMEAYEYRRDELREKLG